MLILEYAEYNKKITVLYEELELHIVRKQNIGLSWEKIFSVYQMIIENDVYMWTATLNVTIHEH